MIDFDYDADALPLAYGVIRSVRLAGGGLAADQDRLLLALPDGADPELQQAVELARPWLLCILHTQQCLQRARFFAAGCRWPSKARKTAILAPIEARRALRA